VARDSGNSGLGIIYLGYNLETADSYKYAGKTVTLSFWAKAGADFSSASSALSVVWASGTGTNQKQMDGFTGSSSLANSSVTLTTLWQRFSFTAAVPSNSTQQGFQFNYTPVGTAGAADNFEIVGVQQEFGSIPTNFKRAGGGTIQGELAACQRYYCRFTAGAATVAVYGSATNPSTTQGNAWVKYPMTMRSTPSSFDSASICIRESSGARRTLSSIVLDTAVTNADLAFIYGTISGGTVGTTGQLTADGTTAGYIGFSAEL
jgi:hypothetical protein